MFRVVRMSDSGAVHSNCAIHAVWGQGWANHNLGKGQEASCCQLGVTAGIAIYLQQQWWARQSLQSTLLSCCNHSNWAANVRFVLCEPNVTASMS